MVVTGPSGAGKSRLVAEAVRGLSGVAWVRATEAASELPFGAFAHLLPEVAPTGNPLRWAASAIGADVLVVDDAHLLDPASAALVHHLAAHGPGRVLATVRGAGASELWKDDLLTRVDLEPFTLSETEEILTGALGGRIESATLARLWRTSQGNALYLRELVLSGVLRDIGGLWLWHGPVTLTTTMRETVAARLGELTPPERDVLELLAYGEPLPAGLLDLPVTEHLETRQLVTVDPDLAVRLAHPLYGEVIREGCGTLRTRAIVRRLADAVGTRRREDVLRVAVWRLDSGDPGDPALLTAACERARAVRDLDLAERLCRAAIAAGGEAPGLRRDLGRILWFADRYEEAETAFREAWDTGVGDFDVTACAVNRAMNLTWGLGRLDDGLAVLSEADERITGLSERHALMIVSVTLHAQSGDLPAAWELLARAERLGPVDQQARRAEAVATAGVLAASGRASEALTVVDDARRLFGLVQDPLPSLLTSLLWAATLACFTTGDLPAVDRLTTEALDDEIAFAHWTRTAVQFTAFQAWGLRLRGQVRDALTRAAEAAVRLPPTSVYAGACLGELAHAHALLGDVDAAEETLRRATTATVAAGPAATVPLQLARAWTLAARGDIAGAVEVALLAGDSPHPSQALFGLHDVVRLGHADLVASRLAELTVEGPLAALFARHAAAATGQELDQVSSDFEEIGFILYAAEGAARAAGRYREDGLTRAARAAETRAWALTRRCQGARTPALMDLDVPGMTPRQREVATLAAQGFTNREIAERLFLSIRTIANTLYTIYEKTGVNDRTALADLLGLADGTKEDMSGGGSNGAPRPQAPESGR